MLSPIDLWAARLDVDDADVERYRSTLDGREIARIERLRRDVDKRDYIVSHGILRSILALYVDLEAAAIEFTYGPFGKPYLGEDGPILSPIPSSFQGKEISPSGNYHHIEFNMSDSGGMLLVAVARGVAVGVDIEKLRPIDVMKFARRFFTAGEAIMLEALPEIDREAAFFRAWTCKEACVKGWGYGIQRNVGLFEVRVGERKSGLVSCSLDNTAPERWSLVDIGIAQGFAATVAAEQHGVESIDIRWWPISVGP